MKKRLTTSLSAMLFMAVSVQAVENASEDRLEEVAKRGAHVMPFNLEQTTMFFLKQRKAVCNRLSSKTVPTPNKSS
jgi:hypothetical protein